MNPWQHLQSELRQYWPKTLHRDHSGQSSVGTVVGCSGGADSVALTLALATMWRQDAASKNGSVTAPLVIGHFNHRWRGNTSDEDQAFVERLAERLELPFEVGSTTEPTSQRDEASARRDRRAFLVDAAHRFGCRYIALAHSVDDQAETVLHQLCRGTGQAGLSGMAFQTPVPRSPCVIIRPWLQVRRSDIRIALSSIKQAWREDASNLNPTFTRNWWRQQIVPMLQTRYPDVIGAIGRASQLQRESHALTQDLARQWVSRFTRVIADPAASWHVSIERDDPWGIAHQLPVIVASCQRVWDELKWPRGAYSREHWLRMARWIVDPDPSSPSMWPGDIKAVIAGNELRFHRHA